jgi:hypothetical protein
MVPKPGTIEACVPALLPLYEILACVPIQFDRNPVAISAPCLNCDL